jgi:hypothetical protein
MAMNSIWGTVAIIILQMDIHLVGASEKGRIVVMMS